MQRSPRFFRFEIFITVIFLFLVGCSPSTDKPTASKNVSFKNTVVSVTFDDGDKDNFSIREVLAKNELHATFYIVSSFVGTDGYMSESDLRALVADGNEIGGHTLSHASLNDLNGEELKRQICEDRSNLQAFGFDVVSFAYPGGQIKDESKQTVKDCGYANARTVVNGPETIPPADLYALRAMPYIVNDTRLPKIQRYINSVEQDGGGWVILIFHHVCDGCDYYAVAPGTFEKLANWFSEQKQNGLMVRTIGEIAH